MPAIPSPPGLAGAVLASALGLAAYGLHARPAAHASPAAAPCAGFTAAETRGRRAVVTSVAAHGPAERAGIAVGDIVLDIDGRRGSGIGTRPLDGPGLAHVVHRGVARTVRLR